MPTYDFACPAGHRFERRMSIRSRVRKVGCVEPGCGKRAVRQVGAAGAINTQPCSSKYPYVSHRLPVGLPGCEHVGAMEKPVIESRQHEDRIFKTFGYDRE